MEGTITYFNPRKSYGFISTPNDDEYFFFHKRSEDRSKSHTIRVGDSVIFDVRESEKRSGELEAAIVSFMANMRWEEFVQDVRMGGVRTGFLKKIDEHWHIKVMPEKFMIRLDVSPFEIDTELVYDLRNNNQLVCAFITVNKKGDVSAVLEDRKMLPVFNQAKSAKNARELLAAEITGSNEHVYFATLYKGKLPVTILKKVLPEGVTYSKKQVLEVRITGISDTNIAVLPDEYVTEKQTSHN